MYNLLCISLRCGCAYHQQACNAMTPEVLIPLPLLPQFSFAVLHSAFLLYSLCSFSCLALSSCLARQLNSDIITHEMLSPALKASLFLFLFISQCVFFDPSFIIVIERLVCHATSLHILQRRTRWACSTCNALRSAGTDHPTPFIIVTCSPGKARLVPYWAFAGTCTCYHYHYYY